jgi:hypothetical protein
MGHIFQTYVKGFSLIVGGFDATIGRLSIFLFIEGHNHRDAPIIIIHDATMDFIHDLTFPTPTSSNIIWATGKSKPPFIHEIFL